MRVNLGTIDVTAFERRVINKHFGRAGLATRADVRGFYLSLAKADVEAFVEAYQDKQRRAQILRAPEES